MSVSCIGNVAFFAKLCVLLQCSKAAVSAFARGCLRRTHGRGCALFSKKHTARLRQSVSAKQCDCANTRAQLRQSFFGKAMAFAKKSARMQRDFSECVRQFSLSAAFACKLVEKIEYFSIRTQKKMKKQLTNFLGQIIMATQSVLLSLLLFAGWCFVVGPKTSTNRCFSNRNKGQCVHDGRRRRVFGVQNSLKQKNK